MNCFRYALCLIVVAGLVGCALVEEPLTPADCFADEYFDAEDETCYPLDEEDDELGAMVEPEEVTDEFDAEEDDLFDDTMTAEDCYDDEYFDEADQTCYLDETLLEEGGISGGWLDNLGETLLDGEIEFSDGEGEGALIQYDIEADQLVDPQLTEGLSGVEADLAADEAGHYALWEQFAALIPADGRSEITRFGIFTDGPDETLAYVEPNPDQPTTWIIVLDPADAADQDDFTYTLIHEYGHVLTLNDRQVPFDEAAYFDEEGETAEAADAACGTFFTGEGCARSTAYINLFFDQFWAEIYDDLPFPDESGEVDEDELADFYDRYADQFVTDYAATNPGEDIAESWSYFVLKPKPAGNTIAEEKILFFYEFPELVALREEILTQLYALSRR